MHIWTKTRLNAVITCAIHCLVYHIRSRFPMLLPVFHVYYAGLVNYHLVYCCYDYRLDSCCYDYCCYAELVSYWLVYYHYEMNLHDDGWILVKDCLYTYRRHIQCRRRPQNSDPSSLPAAPLHLLRWTLRLTTILEFWNSWITIWWRDNMTRLYHDYASDVINKTNKTSVTPFW